MAQKLPPQLPENLNHSDKVSEIRSAYSKILLLEEQAAALADPKLRDEKVVHARILGYLIREGPSIQASEHVAKEVNSCQDNDQMDRIGEMYQLHFIRVFKKYKGGTTEPSSPPSRPPFVTKEEMIDDILLSEAPRDHDQAKKNALVRDGFRCMASGRYDAEYALKNLELEQEVRKATTVMSLVICLTRCVHIFSQSMDISGSDEDGAEHEYAATLWTIMSHFGYESLPEKLSGAGIHSLDNVLTLDANVHSMFDQLHLWFEAVDGEENTYNVCAINDILLPSCKANPIVFKSTHPDLPLPNPVYLRIHAACCRVAHLSGAGKYLDKIQEELEENRALSDDGSSAHILSFALQPHGQEVVTL